MILVLEMAFSDVAGDPWEGRATVRFQGEPSEPFPVREGMTSKERGEVRWYVEQYMDLPEGGNATRAAALEKQLAAYGRRLWDGLTSDVVSQWLGVVQSQGGGRLELRAQTPRDEGAFLSPLRRRWAAKGVRHPREWPPWENGSTCAPAPRSSTRPS